MFQCSSISIAYLEQVNGDKVKIDKFLGTLPSTIYFRKDSDFKQSFLSKNHLPWSETFDTF